MLYELRRDKKGNGRLPPLSGGGKSGHHLDISIFRNVWGKAYGLTTRRGINNARGANRDAIARKSHSSNENWMIPMATSD